MGKDIKIRFTLKEDLKQLPWLYRQYHNGDTKVETNFDGMVAEFERLISNPDYKFVSAMKNDQLVGFCSIVVNHDIVEQQKPIIMIWNLRIHPEFRREKIGTNIISFIEKFGKSINADLVFLTCDIDNESGQKFYKKLGYDCDFTFYKYL